MSRFDPAWLDLQYNNRARIPEHPQIFDRWTRRSAEVRERLSRRLDIRYGDGPSETLDIFPATVAEAPVLVYVHGGYWRSLDKSDFSFIAPSFVQRGVAVVVLNYALCPAVTIDQITMQVVHALAWVHRNIALYGGDPKRIVVAGHSAGGHLAAMLVSCQWKALARDLPGDLVKGALAISGVFDLEPLRHAPFLMEDLQLTPASARQLSPVLFPAPKVPLTTVAGALESEEFLRQNGLLREAWGVEAVPVCETIPERDHLTVVDALAEPQGHLHELALGLLGRSRG